MRPVVGLRSDFSNISWPTSNDTLRDRVGSTNAIFLWIPANLFVLYLSLCSPLVYGNYKYFIANQALADFLYSCSIIFQYIFHLFNETFSIPMTVTRCTIETIFQYVFGFCFQLALPLVSINRYFVIVQRRNQLFTTKLTLFLCSTTYLIPFLWPLIEFCFAPYVSTIFICKYYLMTPYLMESWMIFVCFYVPITLIFCNFKIYVVLSQHISTLSTRLGKTTDQVRNEKSILKALILQSCMPIIFNCPIIVCHFIILFNGWAPISDPTISLSSDANLTFYDLAVIFFGFNTLSDPFITLLVVKQYRIAVHNRSSFDKCMEKSVLFKNSTIPHQNTVTVTPLIVVLPATPTDNVSAV
jgi:hypothetical protein